MKPNKEIFCPHCEYIYRATTSCGNKPCVMCYESTSCPSCGTEGGVYPPHDVRLFIYQKVKNDKPFLLIFNRFKEVKVYVDNNYTKNRAKALKAQRLRTLPALNITNSEIKSQYFMLQTQYQEIKLSALPQCKTFVSKFDSLIESVITQLEIRSDDKILEALKALNLEAKNVLSKKLTYTDDAVLDVIMMRIK